MAMNKLYTKSRLFVAFLEENIRF